MLSLRKGRENIIRGCKASLLGWLCEDGGDQSSIYVICQVNFTFFPFFFN